jgi:glucosyl-dolichyl phosphate glucuronosyltransferase
MNNLPLITIAICTFNRAGYLKDTLNDLGRQSAAPESFEVLVVNNNCTDHTDIVCREFATQYPRLNFRWVEETEQGLSFARNLAVREATSGAILFIDDDVILPDHFVGTALTYLEENPEVLCAGGRIFVSFDEGEPDWIPKELMPMFGLHDLGDKDSAYPSTNFPRGGNMLIKKEVFQKFGMFNTELGRIGTNLLGSEEKEFFDRVRKRGVTLFYWRDLSLQHRIGAERLKIDYLEKQSIGIGASERLRVSGSFLKFTGKLLSEFAKLAASIVLAAGYLITGRGKAARFLLKFRFWVLKGFFSKD